MGKKRTNPYKAAGAAAAAKLEPIQSRMAGCNLLLSAALDDVQAKIKRAATACDEYGEFEPTWVPASEWPQLRERYQAWAVELRNSSKLERAVGEMKIVRSNLGQIIRDLERLIA
jgi:hypothetical protein